MTFEEILKDMQLHGMKLPETTYSFKIPDARENLYNSLKLFLEKENRVIEWIPEYEAVANWLSDNHGKGLFMFGNCGRGKSILCRYVIPFLLLTFNRRIVKSYDIQEMNQNLDEILKQKMVSLDDIGTEELSIKYGEKRMAFAEIMDYAEKYGKLVIVSTNLNEESIRDRYGDRILDRIKSTTIRVKFVGKSLRR